MFLMGANSFDIGSVAGNDQHGERHQRDQNSLQQVSSHGAPAPVVPSPTHSHCRMFQFYYTQFGRICLRLCRKLEYIKYGQIFHFSVIAAMGLPFPGGYRYNKNNQTTMRHAQDWNQPPITGGTP